jgi:hypothetical protein
MSKKSFIEVTTTEGAMLLNTRKIKAIEQISNSNKYFTRRIPILYHDSKDEIKSLVFCLSIKIDSIIALN